MMTNYNGSLRDVLEQSGVSRREFLKFCTVMAGALALRAGMVPKIAEALETAERPVVV